jgi:hypothetical protein
VQIRIVNGSDDSVWWRVACQPEQETVGHLRKRLIKGAGSFAPHLYHDGHALQDSASLKQLGISEYSVLSTGHGASLVYGKKALASIAAARNKGLDVVPDETKRKQSNGVVISDATTKKRWSNAPPTESLWSNAPPVKALSTRSLHSSRTLDGHPEERRRRESSSSSSRSSSSSSSGSDHHRRKSPRHGHRHSRSKDRHAAASRSGSLSGPTLIMPVAVCRCHADPMLFPVHLDSLRPEHIREHAAGCVSAPGARRDTTNKGGVRISSTKAPRRTLSASPDRNEVMPCNRSTAKTVSGERTGSSSKGVHFSSSVVSKHKSSSRQSSPALEKGRDASTFRETVAVGDVLDGILSQAAKKKTMKYIGVLKDETNGLEKTVEAQVLKDRIKELERERDGLRSQVGLLSSRAPDRTGLRTPAFPLENATTCFDPMCGDRPPPSAQQTVTATTAGSMRPGGLSCPCASVHYAHPSNSNALSTQQTMPHYLVADAPYGAYPYKAADDWITCMPEECRPLLAATIHRTIASPGLLKGSAPLYPHAATVAATAGAARMPPFGQYFQNQMAPSLPRPL